MENASVNEALIEGYVQLLETLSPDSKLDLISRLSASVKSDLHAKKSSFQRAFGAFESAKSADEIIAEIRDSRISTRQMEPL